MVRVSLGFDYGTGSLRVLVVDLDRGTELGAAVVDYPHGEGGVISLASTPDLARQHPGDYGAALRLAVPRALQAAGVAARDVVGIGVDTTGSTPLPVDSEGRALADREEFAGEPAAQAWLWKDHCAQAEAEEITALARRVRPEYLARCGGTYSSEWFWAKLLHCARHSPRVFAAATSWVEACDYVPAWLVGERAPASMWRSVCAAGHKALWAREWGGWPDETFLAALAPELAAVRPRLASRMGTVANAAGKLCAEVAGELGLLPGIPVACGAFDAHLGAVGAGIAPGDLVKVIGTSSCDMALAPPRSPLPDATGLCGVVPDSIVPGWLGFEAGQSAVGDVFAWCARLTRREQDDLTREAAALRPGASGLLALDWHNGNRCLLVDPALSGGVLGLGLHTSAAELYRAMIEATAFGARMIVARLVALGVPVSRLIACGGIAHKNPLVMQIYADVLGRPIQVAASTQASALGAAIAGAVVGGVFADVPQAQRQLVRAAPTTYAPHGAATVVYDELFDLYVRLHDAFGKGTAADLRGAMKRLLQLRAAARRA